MPTGQAAACKAASSGFDSHRRLFHATIVDAVRPAAYAGPSSVSWRAFRTWVLKRAVLATVSSVGRAPSLELGCHGCDSRTNVGCKQTPGAKAPSNKPAGGGPDDWSAIGGERFVSDRHRLWRHRLQCDARLNADHRPGSSTGECPVACRYRFDKPAACVRPKSIVKPMPRALADRWMAADPKPLARDRSSIAPHSNV